MLSADRVWPRVAALFPKSQTLRDFRFAAMGLNLTLTTGAESGSTRMDFPAGAIILGITAGISVASQAGTQSIRGRNMISASIDYPNNTALVTGGKMNGDALFGSGERCDFPAKEIVIGVSGSLSYNVLNLSTSTINVSIVHHCLIPAGR